MSQDDDEGEGPEEGEEEGSPPAEAPPEPEGPVPDPPAKLPKTTWMAPGTPRGAVFIMAGAGVRDNAVDVRASARILEHFERLTRIVRLHRSGLDVKRRGRLTEVEGAPRLFATPATAGSYRVPLRLVPPEAEMVVEYHAELEESVALLGLAEGELIQELQALPERAADELIEILRAASAFAVDLEVTAFVGDETTASASVDVGPASQRVALLEDSKWSEPGVSEVRGTLFRIDTKRTKIAVDCEPEGEDAESVVVEADFSMDQLEALRAALHHRVELEVSVLEERRPYERTARGRTMTVTAIVDLGAVE